MNKSYKLCKTAAQLNEYTRQERDSRCGYLDALWNKGGSFQSTKDGLSGFMLHPRQNTFRTEGDLEKELSDGQVAVLKETYLESMQKSDYLKELTFGENEYE